MKIEHRSFLYYVQVHLYRTNTMKTRTNKRSIDSFLIGVGSILNIFPTQKNVAYNKVCPSDTQLLKSDWKAIGGDFNAAMKKIKK